MHCGVREGKEAQCPRCTGQGLGMLVFGYGVGCELASFGSNSGGIGKSLTGHNWSTALGGV